MERLAQLAALCMLLAGFCLVGAAYAQVGTKSSVQQHSSTDPAARAAGTRIIDEYVNAAGGARALSRIQTLLLEGTAVHSSAGKETPQTEGASGTYTLETKLPNRYYSELLVGGKRFIEAYNGKSAWREDTSGEPTTLVSPDSQEMQAEAEVANERLLELKRNSLNAAFVGHAQVRGKDALQVEVTTITGVKRELFFVEQSHLLVEESGKVGGVAEQTFYSDYRPEGGVQIARKLELHVGPDAVDNYKVKITRVTVNQPIGERVFDLPASAQVKLPDLKALMGN